MSGRWATWLEDGASLFLLTIERGRIACRALDEDDALRRTSEAYGTLSRPRDVFRWDVQPPVRRAFALSAALDLDGVLWGLTEDRPYGSPAIEFALATRVGGRS